MSPPLGEMRGEGLGLLAPQCDSVPVRAFRANAPGGWGPEGPSCGGRMRGTFGTSTHDAERRIVHSLRSDLYL